MSLAQLETMLDTVKSKKMTGGAADSALAGILAHSAQKSIYGGDNGFISTGVPLTPQVRPATGGLAPAIYKPYPQIMPTKAGITAAGRGRKTGGGRARGGRSRGDVDSFEGGFLLPALLLKKALGFGMDEKMLGKGRVLGGLESWEGGRVLGGRDRGDLASFEGGVLPAVAVPLITAVAAPVLGALTKSLMGKMFGKGGRRSGGTSRMILSEAEEERLMHGLGIGLMPIMSGVLKGMFGMGGGRTLGGRDRGDLESFEGGDMSKMIELMKKIMTAILRGKFPGHSGAHTRGPGQQTGKPIKDVWDRFDDHPGATGPGWEPDAGGGAREYDELSDEDIAVLNKFKKRIESARRGKRSSKSWAQSIAELSDADRAVLDKFSNKRRSKSGSKMSAAAKKRAASNPWLKHVAAVKAQHPGVAYKDILKMAKSSYHG